MGYGPLQVVLGFPNPSVLFNANDSGTGVVGLVGGQTYEFTWTVTNGTCTDVDMVLITVDANPVDVSAGDDQQLCNVTTTSLSGSNSNR